MGASLACAIQPGENIFEILDRLSQILRQPFSLHYTVYTGKCILILSFAYITGICIYYSQQKNYRRGVEHGSARWGDVHQICKRYADKEYTHNLLLTQNFRMSQEVYKHQRNLNVLVAGGSGAGKSRTYAVPNILQCSQAESKKGGGCSIVVTDPKGELLRKTGGLLERMGYEVRVFDLINPDTSFCYNPFCYVHDDKDVLKLINNLIRNTTPKGSQASDPFWEKSETALLQALMLYLLHEAPPEEQNFPMIMEMLGSAQVKEEDEEYQSPLDILFERLEMRKPDSIAVKQYQIYKQAAGKTAKSILISVGVRLAAFNLKEIANLTCTDELDLASIGEKKVALFCCIPDADTSLNYLVGMIYSNLFQTLYYVADRKYGGRLPVPVHCIMDEWPNVALPDDFDKILATMRSRAISCSIIIQNMAQMKALFKDSWESLVGNCDEFLYLGGNEKEGHKYISELLGKETLDTNTYGQTKGRNGSYSTNYQQTGRELFTPDEIRLLDNRKIVLSGARGNIYDRNGKPLATNKLANSVTFEDQETYNSDRERQLNLNSKIYQMIRIIKSKGDSIETSLKIIIDPNGNFQFSVDDFWLQRFKADVYGKANIDDMEAKERNSTADEIVSYLSDTLVLFTSYSMMGNVYRELRGNLPFPLLKVWKDSQSVIREFKAQKNCVLFAAGSCWEGVDFPGDVVSSLIIVRLPFAVPDPVREAERERYQTLKEYIQKIIVPDMQIKLRQGFGRAIRTETDTCVVSILDSRAGRGGKYHKEVIDALPVCRITDRMADVENFIRNRKRIEYYM